MIDDARLSDELSAMLRRRTGKNFSTIKTVARLSQSRQSTWMAPDPATTEVDIASSIASTLNEGFNANAYAVQSIGDGLRGTIYITELR